MTDKENEPIGKGTAAAGVPEESRAATSGPIEEVEPPTVVYRRPDSDPNAQAAAATPGPGSLWTRELSPAIIPLIVGFLLLLILVGVLGSLSVRRMDEVGRDVLDLEHQHADKLSLLLRLRLAVTRLNNEARARADADSRGGLKPPFEVRLNNARGEANNLLPELARPSLLSDPAWNKFRSDLVAYVDLTKDLHRYSLEGFDGFRVVDSELNQLLEESNQQQIDIYNKSTDIEQAAARSIRNWSVIAMIFGFLVAAGTIWESQRRFGELRRSVEEARRERVFTSQLLEGMVSAVAAIDEHDRIRSANAAFFRIFPRATIGASIYEKFASDASLKMLEAATGSRVDRASYRGRWGCPPDDDREQEQTFDVYSSPLEINIRLLKRLSPRELGHIDYQFAQVFDPALDQFNGMQTLRIADAVAQHGHAQAYAAKRIPDFMRNLSGRLAYRSQRLLPPQTALTLGSFRYVDQRQDLTVRAIDGQRR